MLGDIFQKHTEQKILNLRILLRAPLAVAVLHSSKSESKANRARYSSLSVFVVSFWDSVYCEGITVTRQNILRSPIRVIYHSYFISFLQRSFSMQFHMISMLIFLEIKSGHHINKFEQDLKVDLIWIHLKLRCSYRHVKIIFSTRVTFFHLRYNCLNQIIWKTKMILINKICYVFYVFLFHVDCEHYLTFYQKTFNTNFNITIKAYNHN